MKRHILIGGPPAKRRKTLLRVYIYADECIRGRVRWAECPCMECEAERNLERAIERGGHDKVSLGLKHDVVIYDRGQEDEGLYYDWYTYGGRKSNTQSCFDLIPEKRWCRFMARLWWEKIIQEVWSRRFMSE